MRSRFISSSFSLITISALATASFVKAETSPLSALKDGFGLEVSGYNARERGMGEAGLSSVNRQGSSLLNPSKTAWNDKTSFAATFESDLDYLQDPATGNRLTSFLLPNLAMNFQTRMPLNFGIYYRERFHRNFSFTSPDANNSFGSQTVEMEGGTYILGGTIAYAPIPALALSLGYQQFLGRERTIHSSVFDKDSTNPQTFNARNLTGDTMSIHTNGGSPSASVTYRQKSFSIAATGSLDVTLDRTKNRTITGIQTEEKSTDQVSLPWSGALGFTYKLAPNQIAVADFAFDAWDDATAPVLNSAMHLGAGYEFQGLGGPYDRYYRKVAYRGGLGYERLYLEETDQYYLTAGAGLPLGRRGNLLDVALKYAHREASKSNLWTEDIIKLSVTLTGVGVWGQPIRKRR